jgi:hypothetical protein
MCPHELLDNHVASSIPWCNFYQYAFCGVGQPQMFWGNELQDAHYRTCRHMLVWKVLLELDPAAAYLRRGTIVGACVWADWL